MKYLNVTINCYKSIEMINDKIISLRVPMDNIPAIVDDNGIIRTKPFSIETHLSFRGTNNDAEKRFSVLENKENVSIIIRLTRCDNRMCADLASFIVDFSDNDVSDNIQKGQNVFLDCKRVYHILNGLRLPFGTGKYILKVLVKKASEPEDKYEVQTMSLFNVFLDKNTNEVKLTDFVKNLPNPDINRPQKDVTRYTKSALEARRGETI